MRKSSDPRNSGRSFGRKILMAGAVIAAAVPLTILCSSEGYLAIASAADTPPPARPEALPSILQTKQWLNSKPLTRADLRGKVVVVNFWTYSCINCLRALPHIREWSARYRGQGLEVIGVHTPEFDFEHKAPNIDKAIGALGVNYPVAIDSDFRIWNAFGNEAWPAIYFFDANGKLRHRVYGEGDYAGSERLIQQLLAEARRAPVQASGAHIVATGTQMAPDEANIRSEETYVGYSKATGFAGTGPIRRDRDNVYALPASLPLNQWGLTGRWKVGGEFATGDAASGITYRFHARDLHLVLGAAMPGRPIRYRVTIDGKAPGKDHGSDTDAAGNGEIRDTKLYQLVRQSGAVGDHRFAVQFLDSGAQAYAFTFG